jgi:hypothetical protein
MPAAKKATSRMRFEQCNQLVDTVLRTLPTSIHMGAIFVMWRHADAAGRFRLSAKQLAKSLATSKRYARQIYDELEAGGVIVMTAEQQGTIPRQYCITGRQYSQPRGDLQFPAKQQPAPRSSGEPQCA